jgi:hypothetical protein
MTEKIEISEVQKLINSECQSIRDLLFAKNREYGNAAFEPLGIFCNLDVLSRLDVRIEDKLQRIKTIREMDKTVIHEDTEMDLIGYLILKRVYRHLNHGSTDGNVK